MENFLKFFENKKFVTWVLNPTPELDKFWKDYIKTNPENKKDIDFSKLLIQQLQSKKENYSDTESIELFSGIIKKLEPKKQKNRFRKQALQSTKYAAVGILFFFLGVTFYYYQKPETAPVTHQEITLGQNQQSAQLILSDGKKVTIPEKESKIEYRQNGQIIINKKDTITVEPNATKKELNHLFVPFGRNSSITLPDGTVAFLNAGSQLDYPDSFGGKKREVSLNGEGFFEVAHNAEKPFIVKTHNLNVEVLGTKFNLSAYAGDHIVETILVEGKVKLKKTGFSLLTKELILTPNQRAVYYPENGETSISEVDVKSYISWRDGYLNLETLALNRVVKRLERYYNIRIVLNDPFLGMKTITGKLSLNEEPEKVLDVLAKTASIEIIKINQSKYILK